MAGSLKSSESLLEKAFFHEQQSELLASLRGQTEPQQRRDALRAASGLDNDAVIDKLVALELSAETLSALSLVPLIEVAWADGSMADKERDAVLEAAGKQGIAKGSEAYELLRTWMAIRPGDELRQTWGSYVRELTTHLSDDERHGLRDQLIGRARGVAQAAGGLLGIAAISKAEEQALLELEAAFEA